MTILGIKNYYICVNSISAFYKDFDTVIILTCGQQLIIECENQKEADSTIDLIKTAIRNEGRK